MKLYILLFFSISTLIAQNLPSMYVGEITFKDKESSIYSSKIKNQIITVIVKYYKDKYAILDDELVKQLASKMAKLQKQGCDETQCRIALDAAIDWDEKIVGELQKENNYFLLTLKTYTMDKTTYQPKVKVSLQEKFILTDMEKYVNEMSRTAIDEKYSSHFLNKEKNIDINLSTLSLKQKIFIGNSLFPGYNRIENDDYSGYFLGSIWTLSMIGIASNYPIYMKNKDNNIFWANFANYSPVFAASGAEFLGTYYAVNQMNKYYTQSLEKANTINSFSVIGLAVWSYSWLYKPENNLGVYRLPDSDWFLDFKVSRREVFDKTENQYQMNFIRNF